MEFLYYETYTDNTQCTTEPLGHAGSVLSGFSGEADADGRQRDCDRSTHTAASFLCKSFWKNSRGRRISGAAAAHLLRREQPARHAAGADTEAITELNRFLPFVDNWATCDLLALPVLGKHLDRLIPEIDRWLTSDHTYTVRFAIGLLMRYYLEDAFRPEYSDRVLRVCSEEYYINMMSAWYFATALAKQYDAILPCLTEHRLDVWTHNKTIQKAIESYRITPEQKAFLRTLRVKKNA